MHPSSGVRYPGTFPGVVEKIPYLQSLGVTAVELLPVHEFYENELTRRNPLTGERLRNYWGYSTVAFFAPKESYGSRSYMGCQVSEFKAMVRELHRAGIEIIPGFKNGKQQTFSKYQGLYQQFLTKEEKMGKKVIMKVGDMKCAGCEGTIRKRLLTLQGVYDARANFKNGEIFLDVDSRFQASEADKAMREIGYTIVDMTS